MFTRSMFIQPPGKKLDIFKISGMFFGGFGKVLEYFWPIFGEHFGTCLRGFSNILKGFYTVLGKAFRG